MTIQKCFIQPVVQLVVQVNVADRFLYYWPITDTSVFTWLRGLLPSPNALAAVGEDMQAPGSKTLHQLNAPVLNWRCRLTQVDLSNHRCCNVVVDLGSWGLMSWSRFCPHRHDPITGFTLQLVSHDDSFTWLIHTPSWTSYWETRKKRTVWRWCHLLQFLFKLPHSILRSAQLLLQLWSCMYANKWGTFLWYNNH